MVDPTGRLITLLRDDAAIAAITPRVGGWRGASWEPPFVVVRRLTSVPWISDPGTEGAGVTTIRYSVLCYARKVDTGDVLAFQLAGAVHDAVGDHGLITFPVSTARGVIYRVQEDLIGAALRDPVTGEPYVPVSLSVLAGAQAFASVS